MSDKQTKAEMPAMEAISERVDQIEARSLELAERAEVLERRTARVRESLARLASRVDARIAEATAFLDEQAERLGLQRKI